MAITDTTTAPLGKKSSGLLRPTPASDLSSGGVIHNTPLWLESNPKNGNVYVYDSAGSVYSIDVNFSAVTAVGDLTDGGTSNGNGAAYYDNYLYFARDTTIARYGPLNGTPTFADDYWVGTLGLTALDNSYRTNYPFANQLGSGTVVRYPNHVLHRHSDGRLYIADVVGGQGTLHYVKTTKATVEGDTNDGSKYSALTVGYGLLPTVMESYGSDLAIAFYEGSGNFVSQTRAKVAFWDTTSQNINKITWVEFPDPYISSMKNINGVLYVASGRAGADGFRVSRFVGGYTFEEVGLFGRGAMPFPDGMDGQSNQLIFASFTNAPTKAGCVHAIGLNNAKLGQGQFNIHRVSSGASSAVATALYLQDNYSMDRLAPVVAWGTGGNGTSKNGIDIPSGYGNSTNIWWSQLYRIGQPFKIKRIRIPTCQYLTSAMTLTLTIYFDSGNDSTDGTTINSTLFGTTTQMINIRPSNLAANNDFFLELKWSGTSLLVVALPITVEYELLDVEAAYP